MKIKKGFSLVEILLTIVFLTVIVSGVIKLQTSNLTLAGTQNRTLQAHFWALEGAEILEILGETYLESKCATGTCTLALTLSGSDYGLEAGTENLVGGFSRTVFLETLVAPFPANDAFQATVRVFWTDSGGNHTAEAKRIIY